jgi:hypothetical protein
MVTSRPVDESPAVGDGRLKSTPRRSDVTRVTAGQLSADAPTQDIAAVIPLLATARERGGERPAPAVGQGPVATARGVLERRVGASAVDLPTGLGRAALRLEVLLATGPTGTDPARTAPGVAIATADRILTAAAGALDLIGAEGEVLGEALSAPLLDLPIGQLAEIADAVLVLSVAPAGDPGWGNPAAAETAGTILSAAAEDLRAAAMTHARLYERWTESVWDIPDTRLAAARRPWRVLTRARVARGLRAVSRSGRVQGGTRAAAREILEARAARERLDVLAPVVAQHLGQLGRGPLSDVDAALDAVRAVRDLQRALGDRVHPARLSRLLEAAAFRSHDVAGPAVNLRNAVRAWRGDVAAVGGVDVPGMRLDDLATWADDCCALLPALTHGHSEMIRLGLSAPTLSSLVEALALREHLARLEAVEGTVPTSSWSAS